MSDSDENESIDGSSVSGSHESSETSNNGSSISSGNNSVAPQSKISTKGGRCGESSNNSISSRESSVMVITESQESLKTPEPSTKKKIRRTNAQIEADKIQKSAELQQKSQSKAAAKTKSETKTDPQVLTEVNGVSFTVQTARSAWSTAEQIALITAYKNWEESSRTSQNKKLCPISKLWLVHIPTLMGKSFGRVRVTPNNLLASSPYQSKWLAIRKKVSDFKAAQVDGREEELPDIEGPTGGGVDENGVEDDRMVDAAKVEVARDLKRNNRYVIADVDEESMKIIQHFIATFPESVSGIGLMTENEATSGAGRKRNACDVDGLNDTAVLEDFLGSPPPKKVSKSSLIIDLTRTAVLHHEENMAFNKSTLEYQKEIRLQDNTRREDVDYREVKYRKKQDALKQERYMTEQTRLAETRQDNREMQATFAGILERLMDRI